MTAGLSPWRVLVLLVLWCLPPGLALAQETGAVSGVVVSTWDGSPVPGVVVTVRGTTLAAQTDANGRFQLDSVPPGEQVLRFSKSGFAAAMVTEARVLPGQTTVVNGNLRPEFYELEEFEVTAEEFTEQTEQILEERKEVSTLMDALGSEQISRLGAGDAAEALSKVTGASVAEGKFAVIRGLADRYTSTTLNGNEVPSADPDRKAAQLDLFPSQFIGRMDVSKTFSPDMPGGFAGGAINIVTRDFPDRFIFNFSAGTSYNTQSSLRDGFPVSDHGSTDWLALDDGGRALPGVAAQTNPRADGTQRPLGPAVRESLADRLFSPIAGDSGLNSSFSLTVGDRIKLFDRPLGLVGGMTYKNDYHFYDDGVVNKYNNFDGQVYPRQDVRSLIEYSWGSLVSLAYQLFDNHTLGFNFMYVQTAEDEARRLVGQDDTVSTVPGESYLDQSILHWTERNLGYYQLKGEHLFPEWNDVRFDWAGSLSATTQEEPDHSVFQFFAQPGDPDDPTDDFYNAQSPSQPDKPTRFFRDLEEGNLSWRGDLTFPLPSYTSKENAIKTGVATSRSNRDYRSRAFELRFNSNSDFRSTGNPNHLDGRYEYHHFLGNFEYTGEQSIDAAYLMADWAALERLKLVGGFRYEHTDITVDSLNLTTGIPANAGIQQSDLLPSLSATFFIRTNLLLRGAWSQTVIRPTYRELGRVEIYDIARLRTYLGNPDLSMSSSDNYDLRLEWYPRSGEIVSVGVFLKNIDSPIEQRSTQQDNSIVDFANFEEAEVRGIEFEARKNLGTLWNPLEEFTLGFNYAYIQSEVPLTAQEQSNRFQGYGGTDKTRPLYDQPQYVINGDLTWEHARSGTAVTLSGGVVGRRLIVVGLREPDEYQDPAPQLDVFVSQKIGKHWKAKFSAKNLLNPSIEESRDHPKFARQVLESNTRGTTFGLSVSCEF